MLVNCTFLEYKYTFCEIASCFLTEYLNIKNCFVISKEQIFGRSKKYGGRLTLSPCRFFPMSRLIRFSKYVQEHLSRKRKKFSLVCGLNDLFSNITSFINYVRNNVVRRFLLFSS